MFLGSVPNRVAHEAPTDVLIAKTVDRTVEDITPGHGGVVDVKGQKLAGETRLNFHNCVTDASWMNEVLSHRLYRDAGVPAAGTAYARVYVTVPGLYDHKYFGLYSVVRDMDNGAEQEFRIRHDQPAAVLEATFAPRKVDSPEGDGYLIVPVSKWAENLGEFLIFDTDDITAGPICRIELPFRMGWTPHGHWMDFRSPGRNIPKLQDGYNRKGLLSEKGEKKQAFELFQKTYKNHSVGKPE